MIQIKNRLRQLRRKLLGPQGPVDRFGPKAGSPAPAGGPRSRILLINQDHDLAQTQFHAFKRFEARFAAQGFSFTSVTYDKIVAGAAVPQADAVFVQSGYEPIEGELENVLSRVRRANPTAAISYFDWFAPTDIRFAERVAPFVDHYVKKSLMRNRSEYLRPLLGHTNLSDHYGTTYGADNPVATWSIPPTIVPRLAVGPSFSTGRALIGRFEQATPSFESDRPIDLHARIATKGLPWYALMRQQAAAAADQVSGIEKTSGMIAKDLYMAELGRSKICFSPFGYGEICWRDFEAIAMGAVLLKPSMDHVESDPDIYVADETYVPVRWDFADLDDQVRALLRDPARRARLTANAYAVVHDHLHGDDLERWLATLLEHRPAIAA
ncbi:glycosyltransferase [uncultured Sphingomonas sp.]|uniref:glycosyltransferase n=1 Tax=uncultured Sphingomonas sp. TaxID=158754 RepID=UPI0035CA6837